MGEPLENWLSEFAAKPSTQKQYSYNLKRFLEWIQMTDEEIVKEYEQSKEKEFAKKWGQKVIIYYNELISKGLKSNSAKNQITGVRSFFTSQCVSVRIKRGAIAGPKMAKGEHEFTLIELRKMFAIGSIEDKARLCLGLNLGWSASDFLSLSWEFIEPYLAEGLEPPVGFWYERGKNGAPMRGHLTHECIDVLRQYREVSKSDLITPITVDALNIWIRSLAKRAGISPRGHIRYHLLRKFLFTALINAKVPQIHAKVIIGKKVAVSDSTYLQSLAPTLRNEYLNAHPYFSLSEFTNRNHKKVRDMKQELDELKKTVAELQRTIENLSSKEN